MALPSVSLTVFRAYPLAFNQVFLSKTVLLHCYFFLLAAGARAANRGIDRTFESESPAKLEPHRRGESTSPLHARARLLLYDRYNCLPQVRHCRHGEQQHGILVFFGTPLFRQRVEHDHHAFNGSLLFHNLPCRNRSVLYHRGGWGLIYL